MLWVAFGISLVVSVVVIMGVLHSSDKPDASGEQSKPDFVDAELARAAVELYAIRRRLDTALTRSELSREADRRRHELAEEMRRIEILESREAKGEW
jgi:hypothetical protein